MNLNYSIAVIAMLMIAVRTTPAFALQSMPETQTVTLGDDSLTAGIPGDGALSLRQIADWLNDGNNHVELKIRLPQGLDKAKANLAIPANNPMTRAKIELGRQLFFDPRLSPDATISCASCHVPGQGFGAHTRFGVGIRGQTGDRNSPVSYNRIVSTGQFWDGRAGSLEEQAIGPIANPIEMGSTHVACVATLSGITGYRIQFEKIFSNGVTIENVGKAIATFERTIVTAATPYDYFQAVARFESGMGDEMEFIDEDPVLLKRYAELKQKAAENPMSESARRGLALAFGKARCAVCHSGANFSDERFYNLGVGMDANNPDLGRFNVTQNDLDRGAFKIPTLRNVAVSAPYMHDGSQATLEEVVEWYDKGGQANPWISNQLSPLELTDQEKSDLVAFLNEGLTSDFPKIEPGRLPR